MNRMMSINHLSEYLNKDRRTITKKLESLTPKIEGRSHLYDIREALPLIYGEGQNDFSQKRLAEEQLRYETERADKLALQNAKLRGELIPANEISSVMERQHSAVRAQLLTIPHKAASLVIGLGTVIEVKTTLEDLVNEALSEMSSVEFSIRHGFAEDLPNADGDGEVSRTSIPEDI